MLPDYLQEGLDVVFIGTAVGDVSASKGHYYAGYTNAFYKCIYESGLVPELLTYEDDYRLPEFGIGVTDIIKHTHAGDDTKLSKADLLAGVPLLKEKLLRFQPGLACFTSKTGYTAYAGPGKHHYGLTGLSIGKTQIFVVPSTSGRVYGKWSFDGKTRLEWFEEIVRLRDLAKNQQS